MILMLKYKKTLVRFPIEGAKKARQPFLLLFRNNIGVIALLSASMNTWRQTNLLDNPGLDYRNMTIFFTIVLLTEPEMAFAMSRAK